jgi:hypothetical protein
MFAIRTLMIIALASCTFAFVGCTSAKSKGASPNDVGIAQNESGSPDQAPANVDKRGNEKVVLTYDDRMDVYVVDGHDDWYYTAGQFYRKVQGAWEWSVCVSGPWKAVANRNDLPPGLRKYKA